MLDTVGLVLSLLGELGLLVFWGSPLQTHGVHCRGQQNTLSVLNREAHTAAQKVSTSPL